VQWTAAHTILYVFNSVLTIKSTTVQDDIAALYSEGHPGEPPAHPIYDRDRYNLQFDHGDLALYQNPFAEGDTHNMHSDAFQLCKATYYANPEIDMQSKAYMRGPETKSQSVHWSPDPVTCAYDTWYIRGQEVAMALLARFILRWSDSVSVPPVSCCKHQLSPADSYSVSSSCHRHERF
jgi:hypothetical protein